MSAPENTIDILLLGSGGREHALAAKLAESPRCGTLYIAPGSGGTLEFLNKRSSAADTEHPLLAQRRITFYCEDIFAIVLRDDVFKDFFRLGSGGSHQSIVVIEGNQGKDDVLRQWVSGADKRFGTAGAFQAVDPYHRNARFILQRPGNLWCHSRA